MLCRLVRPIVQKHSPISGKCDLHLQTSKYNAAWPIIYFSQCDMSPLILNQTRIHGLLICLINFVCIRVGTLSPKKKKAALCKSYLWMSHDIVCCPHEEFLALLRNGKLCIPLSYIISNFILSSFRAELSMR